MKMRINLEGRIKNTKLSPANCLFPLYEAIINSLHAIEERGNKGDGYVNIEIHRDYFTRTLDPKDEGYNPPIIGFSIEDNGIGFNKDNYDAFITADTTRKSKKGGKGVGRFLWLKAFDYVNIESTYRENGGFFKREFDFTIKDGGSSSDYSEEVREQENKTIVHLRKYKEEYEKHCPHKASIIAERIIYHFLSYFVFEFCPAMNLVDNKKTIDLKEIFCNEIKPKLQSENFEVNEEKFQLLHVRQYGGSEDNEHRLVLCGNGREVKGKSLSNNIVDLQKKIRDEDDNFFYYIGLVSGKYLDEHLDMERIDFTIPKKSGRNLFPEWISEEQLQEEAVGIIRTYLDDYLKPIREEKVKNYKNLVHGELPEYRNMIKEMPEVLNVIKPGLSIEQFETVMHEKHRDYKRKIEDETNKLIKLNFKDIRDYEEYERKCSEVVEKITASDKDALARLVIHRKAIIDLLEKNLNLSLDGKYAYESSVHSLIFPQGKTSDDIPYQYQNLWLIDERYAFHSYLASDKKAKKYKGVQTESGRELDIYIESLAFTEVDTEFPSIAIVEFKRPNREEYGKDDNPIEQIIDYIEMIREGKAKTHKGRIIKYIDGMRFYCYIICTVTPKIENFAGKKNFSVKFDKSGWFQYHDTYRAWIEIIDYDTLIRDAKRRNKALFEALNIRNY